MPAPLNLLDRRFGSLRVESRSERKSHGNYLWNCQCDCGNIALVRGSYLRCGLTRSCGCAVAIAATRPRTHGQTHTPLYQRWRAMLGRTGNPNAKAFVNYGGRGIKVCERWRYFENFAEDMGLSFNPALELDRRDNSGDYEPANCRWISRRDQTLNQRRNHRVVWHGHDLTVTEWAEILCLKPNTLIYRLRRGWPTERALSKDANPAALLEIANS